MLQRAVTTRYFEKLKEDKKPLSGNNTLKNNFQSKT